MGARQTTDSAEFNRLQQAYNQAIEAFEAATQNKKIAKKAYKKAVKAKADKQTQFLAFHELESAALLKRLKAFQMETAKNELKTFVKAQPKVEKSKKQDADAIVITAPAEIEDAIELDSHAEVLSAPIGMHIVHEDVVPHTVLVKGFMPALLAEMADVSDEGAVDANALKSFETQEMPVALVEVIDNQAVVEDYDAINAVQTLTHVVENEAVVEDAEAINEAEAFAHVVENELVIEEMDTAETLAYKTAEHQAIAETCEALDAQDAKLEIIAALEALEEEKELEVTRVMEYQAMAEVFEAMETENANEPTEEHPYDIMGAVAPEIDEIQPVEHQIVASAAMPKIIATSEVNVQLELPKNTPVDASIYMAGNFNNWTANDEDYKLTRQEDGRYTITIYPPVGKVEFKLTRGDWSLTEGDHYKNHELECDGSPMNFEANVVAWRDLGLPVETPQVVENEVVVENCEAINEAEVLAHVVENEAVVENCEAINEVEALAHVVENQAVIENCEAINEAEALAHVVENQAVVENCEAINETEAFAHVVENEAVVENCEAINEVEALAHVVENEAVVENCEAINEAEALAHVVENQAVVENCEAINEAEALAHVVENQAVVENSEVINEVETLAHVVENEAVIENCEDCEAINAVQAFAQIEQEEIGAEVEPAIETQLVEHQVVASAPMPEIIATSEVQIQLELPKNTPADASIYMAGNFNNWTAKDEDYKLARQEDGRYAITIHPPVGKVEFKLTRGDWSLTEGDHYKNHEFECDGSPMNFEANVVAWRDLGLPVETAQVVENEVVIEDCEAINAAEILAHVVENEAVIEGCEAINAAETLAHVVENEVVIEDCEAINAAETLAHVVENEVVIEDCEAINAAETLAHVVENEAVIEDCEAINAAETLAYVVENEAVVEDCEAINAAETLAHVVENEVVVENCEAIHEAETFAHEVVAEVEPVFETQLVENQIVAGAAMPEILEEAIIEQPIAEAVMPTGEATIILKLPANTPADAQIYMAGNFNNWVANDENYKMHLQADGNYAITIHPPLGKVEFKLTRGDWSLTEGDHYKNHEFECVDSPVHFEANVVAWRDLGMPATETHVIEYQEVTPLITAFAPAVEHHEAEREIVEQHEVAPVMETHVLDFQPVAESTQVVEHHEVEPVMETHVVEHNEIVTAPIVEQHEVTPVIEAHIVEYQSLTQPEIESTVFDYKFPIEIESNTEIQPVAEITEVVEHHEVAPVMETHVLDFQPVAEITEVVEHYEVVPVMETHVLDSQPVADITEVVEHYEVAPVMETYVLDSQPVAEITEVVEHHEVAPVMETHVLDFQPVAEITEVVEHHEVTPVMETHVLDSQPVAEITEVVEHHEVASVIETHVLDSQPVAEITQVVEHHETAPVMETEVVEHHAMAAMPEILLNEVTSTHEVIETSIPATEVVEHHVITNAKEEESHLQEAYDHWERNQKFIGDDLKIIEGIGPKIEQLLNDIGILTYRQLSLMKVEFLEELLKTAGKRYASHEPATWPAQAKLAATGKMAELKRLQERISYGRLDG